MLTFSDYSYENLPQHAALIRQCPHRVNDLSVGSFLMWNEGTGLQFAVYNDTFICKVYYGDDPAFCYPFGKDPDGAVDALMAYTRQQDMSLKFYCVNEDLLTKLQADKRFGTLMAAYDRRWSDYIYDINEMAQFAGRKFGGQRNHINKFRKTYGEPDFRPITGDDLAAIREMLAAYRQQHKKGGLEKSEYKHTYDLLEHFDELQMLGGAMHYDGKVIAFTIGELVGDTLIIHVEKALTEYEGVYPTTFQCFVRYVLATADRPLKWVNREDDCGDMGLRTSKTQYHPVQLQHKYIVNIDSPAAGLQMPLSVPFPGGCLTDIREGDKAKYFALSTDKENNRYWGYDYEEDKTFMPDPDEDAFYNMQAFDMALGESVNFAVREHPEGDLVGETIIYRFTPSGHAEIGGRIDKEHQGKGLGTAAFAATADFAERVLGVKPKAKCYKQNAPSYHMITWAGFRQSGEDETFYYFER